MTRIAIALTALALVVAAPALAQPEGLSAGRSFGFGLQWTGEAFGISVRYWASPALGGEVDLLFLPGSFANLTLRALSKAAPPGWAFDTPGTDYYLGAGFGMLNVRGEDPSFFLQGFAGIEANASRTLAWNLEWGVDYLAGTVARETGHILAVVFGRGVHLYPVE